MAGHQAPPQAVGVGLTPPETAVANPCQRTRWAAEVLEQIEELVGGVEGADDS
jgi:hypothetical protein